MVITNGLAGMYGWLIGVWRGYYLMDYVGPYEKATKSRKSDWTELPHRSVFGDPDSINVPQCSKNLNPSSYNYTHLICQTPWSFPLFGLVFSCIFDSAQPDMPITWSGGLIFQCSWDQICQGLWPCFQSRIAVVPWTLISRPSTYWVTSSSPSLYSKAKRSQMAHNTMVHSLTCVACDCLINTERKASMPQLLFWQNNLTIGTGI